MEAMFTVKQDIAEVKTIALATKDQAEKTNGRLLLVEQWKSNIQAVEKYKAKNPTVNKADTVVVNPIFSSEKVKTAIIGAVAAVGLLVIAAADFLRARLGG